MTDEQYNIILSKFKDIEKEVKDKGHFLIIILLLFILSHSCSILRILENMEGVK